MMRQTLMPAFTLSVALLTIGCNKDSKPELQQLEDVPTKTEQGEHVASLIESEQARAALIELVQHTDDILNLSQRDALKSSPATPVVIQRDTGYDSPVPPFEATFRIGNWFINQKASTFKVLLQSRSVLEAYGTFEANSEGKWKATITGHMHALPIRR